MKKTTLKTLLVAIVVVVMSLSTLLVACQDPANPQPGGAIVIIADKTTVMKGDVVNLTIATNPKGEYTVTTDKPELVEIDEDKVKFVGDITEDVVVTITVAMKDNASVKESKAITFKAPYIPDPVKTIKIIADKQNVVKGDVVNLTVTVDEGEEYEIFATPSELVALNGNTATFVGDITRDVFVTFKAVLKSDSEVSSSVNVKFKAPTQEGQVGDLTSAMIEAIGVDQIAVEGILSDVYKDFKNSRNNSLNEYNFKVVMEDGKWLGQWNHKSEPDIVVTNIYAKSDEIVTSWKDSTTGIAPQGNALLQVYVNKNNEIARKVVKNYESLPSIWQSQHLWNHLGNLDVNTFEYDPETGLYMHKLDVKNETDLYLMTYLSFSLTPMLEDTLDQIGFKVEDGKIVGMIGQTEVLYYGEDTKEDPEAMSYSRFELTFSEVGSAVVPDPESYEAPEHVDLLESAINQIKSAKSFTFMAADTITVAPTGDDGDYSTSSASSNYNLLSTSASNYSSSKGTEGLFGQVTEDAILLARTIKHSYTMDNENAYRTEYTGYKQNDDNTYDFFEYSYSDSALKGKSKHPGNISDLLPKFDFSSSIFSFEGAVSKNGVSYYTFSLRDSAINRDVAMEMSMHTNASSSASALDRKITIIVDGDGNMVSTSYPYSLSGVYYGYITTTYSDLGSTELEADVFDGYVPREWAKTWDGYICKYFTSNPGVEGTHEENALTAFKAVLGDRTLPSPIAFMEAFGDNWSGPFFDYTADGVDADGKTIWKYGISIDAKVTEGLDENQKILDYDAVFARIINAFAKEGFSKDTANSTGTNWLTLINEATDVQIVIENIGSAYFYIDIYVLGDWTLTK